MEFSASPMSDRQRTYRDTYRSRVTGWYNGWLHVFVIYTIGLTALYIYISSMNGITVLESCHSVGSIGNGSPSSHPLARRLAANFAIPGSSHRA